MFKRVAWAALLAIVFFGAALTVSVGKVPAASAYGPCLGTRVVVPVYFIRYDGTQAVGYDCVASYFNGYSYVQQVNYQPNVYPQPFYQPGYIVYYISATGVCSILDHDGRPLNDCPGSQVRLGSDLNCALRALDLNLYNNCGGRIQNVIYRPY